MTPDRTNFKAKTFYSWMQKIQSVKYAEMRWGYDFIDAQIDKSLKEINNLNNK